MSEPIEARFRVLMNELARVIDIYFNAPKGKRNISDVKTREVGFVLLVFPYGEKEGKRCNYISNGADRDGMKAMFKEIIARWEGQPEVPTTRA